MDDGDGVGTDVVVGEVDAPKGQKGADGEERVGRVLEGRKVDEWRVELAREVGARADQGQDDGGVEEHDEAHDAHRPAEADAVEKRLGDGWEDHAAGSGAAGLEGDGDGALFGEVGGDEGDDGRKEQAAAYAGADALGEDELPVLVG